MLLAAARRPELFRAIVMLDAPILGTLQGWKHGFDSPFRSEVYFLNTRQVTDLRWGTPQPVTVRDPDFKMVQVRANGLCVVRIADPEVFLREVIGTDSAVEAEEITELLRRVIPEYRDAGYRQGRLISRDRTCLR